MILYADHGQGPSTTTIRIAASSQANPFACISAGIASLWGPLHGGADEAVIKMLEEIGNEDNIDKFLDQVKNKERKLMGFGHRIYKCYDPRAKIIKEMCIEFQDRIDNKLFRIGLALEEKALKDEYFIKRKLYPNADFFLGIVLEVSAILICSSHS